MNATVTSSAADANGDLVLTVDPDYGQEAVLNARNIADYDSRIDVRLICAAAATKGDSVAACAGYRSRVVPPSVGAHISIWGALVRDATNGAQAVRPAWEVSTIATPAIPAPLIVLQTRQTWKLIRAQWPAIPAAIVIGQDNPPVYAYAALYDDGIAHVFIRQSDVFDPHQIWHEAGHILHAVAMQARGKRSDLFTGADTVGQEFWTARKLPFAYKDFIATGNWLTLSYEELAECFAAVNLDDKERAETYGVPLDKSAMLAFFRSLSAPAQ